MTTRAEKNRMIRKVWLPAEMRTAVVEYCWKNRLKPASLVSDAVKNLTADPSSIAGRAIPPAGRDYISTYISTPEWEAGVAMAEAVGTTLSAMVRVEIARLLEEGGVTWEDRSVRPRNDHIPSLE